MYSIWGIYNWSIDNVEVNDNKIVILRNNEVIYEGKLNCTISNYDFSEVFY